jgi:hypothetical protein
MRVAAIRALASAVTVAVAVGCASSTLHWTKPGATRDDFNRDSYECAQQHSRDTFTWRPPIAGGPEYGPAVNKDLYRACLQSRGYQRVEGGEWIGIRD